MLQDPFVLVELLSWYFNHCDFFLSSSPMSSILKQRIAQLQANCGKSSLFPDSPGGLGEVNPLAPRCGRVFAYGPSASHVCGGAVKGGKVCLRLKSEGDPACKGHEPGVVKVDDGTLYVRAAKGPMLTSVYDSYPYLCTQAFGWSKDFILGDLDDQENNPLAWKKAVLNLLGAKTSSPTKPWVYQTKFDGSLAAFFGTYIDDIRTGDGSEAGCRRTTRRVASRINYLSQQDAPCKRRPPSKKNLVLGQEQCVNQSVDRASLLPVPRKSGTRQRKTYHKGNKRLWSRKAPHCLIKGLRGMLVSWCI